MERARKHSRKRDAILDCIHGTKCHPTADWIYQQLKPEIPDLSLGTVYRNLSMFKDEGIIQSIGVVNGLERFSYNTEPHTHFICTHCHQVIDLEGIELPAETLGEAEARTGGAITGFQLQFSGQCGQCSREAEQSLS